MPLSLLRSAICCCWSPTQARAQPRRALKKQCRLSRVATSQCLHASTHGLLRAMQRVVLENQERARSAAPLAVLVNHNSASASEILAGALRDNGRVVGLVGETTYGKGKIQSVFELDDGSALFVTVAKCAALLPSQCCPYPPPRARHGQACTCRWMGLDGVNI